MALIGALIVLDNREIAACGNSVRSDRMSTRHAEINAIEVAQKALGSRDLSGCTLYTSAEPCPMCAGAIHWAKVSRLVYGASISSLRVMGEENTGRQLPLRCWEVLEDSGCKIVGSVAEDRALELFL